MGRRLLIRHSCRLCQEVLCCPVGMKARLILSMLQTTPNPNSIRSSLAQGHHAHTASRWDPKGKYFDQNFEHKYQIHILMIDWYGKWSVSLYWTLVQFYLKHSFTFTHTFTQCIYVQHFDLCVRGRPLWPLSHSGPLYFYLLRQDFFQEIHLCSKFKTWSFVWLYSVCVCSKCKQGETW